jgi:hypothetical protein
VNSPPPPSPELPPAAGAQSAQTFDEEVRSAVSYERGLAVKALIALAIVALVVTIRLLFLG